MNIRVIEELSEEQIDELFELYQQEDWTKDRKIDEIRIMLKHCKIIGLVDEATNKLVGFTRIVTDYVYRATVYDVIVLKEYHGKGLGRQLMENIINHPQLKNIERVDLYTGEEKTEFYKKWGFNKVSELTHFMRKTNY
jgi:ribosomal protein S18 acetylase RimI-like enzyme